MIGRDASVVSRELARNTSKRGYRATTAHKRADRRRKRPQDRHMDTEPVLRTRVLHDLGHGRTPRQIAGRLKLEAGGESVEPMEDSIPADGERISHEAFHTWIYALPEGEPVRLGMMLPSKRGARRPGGRTAWPAGGSWGCAPPASTPTRPKATGSPGTGKAISWWARRARAR
uniref:hypothetical protein n=1 Tax=Nocardiopsis kunsanensis TaxID=141693 RepID=UPI00034A0808